MAEETLNIVFDLDGTLIDTSDRHYGVYKEITESLGGVPIEQAKYWDLKRTKVSWPKLMQVSQLDESLSDTFLTRFITVVEDPKRLTLDKLFPKTIETLETLDIHNLYLVSLRRHAENILNQLDELGLSQYFKEIRTGHTESEGYQFKIKLIQDMLGSNTPDFMVGDTEHDIRAAHELKATSVAVLSGIRDEKFLRELKPTFVIDQIGELPDLLAKDEKDTYNN